MFSPRSQQEIRRLCCSHTMEHYAEKKLCCCVWMTSTGGRIPLAFEQQSPRTRCRGRSCSLIRPGRASKSTLRRTAQPLPLPTEPRQMAPFFCRTHTVILASQSRNGLSKIFLTGSAMLLRFPADAAQDAPFDAHRTQKKWDGSPGCEPLCTPSDDREHRNLPAYRSF